MDEWVDLEGPPEWLRLLVLNWLLSRIDDPYEGLRRQPDFENLWFGLVPGQLQRWRGGWVLVMDTRRGACHPV